jgi:hypothetical protein
VAGVVVSVDEVDIDEPAAAPAFRKLGRMTIHPRHLLLLALALAACGPDRPADTADAPSADTGRAAAAPVDTPAAPPAAARAGSAVILAADGLELAGDGASRLPFGTARARVLAAIGGAMGEPTQQGMQEECPAGPLYQVGYAKGLQLVFQDSAFVGWFAREGSALRTAAGVGQGSTLAQLRAAYPATKVEETSLGYEFDAGELYGIVTDTTDAGVVEVIFAGINCIFR